jgi:hypothetical protein
VALAEMEEYRAVVEVAGVRGRQAELAGKEPAEKCW